MCSVQEEDTDVPLLKEKVSVGRKCMKCRTENAVLITRVKDAFCRACFMVYVTHKFRATIGKSKLVRDGENVLVAFSGGPASTCLLHLIEEGLSQRAHKKLRFRPGIIFIDESGVIDGTAEDTQHKHERIAEIMAATGYPCHHHHIEEALHLDIEGSVVKDDLSSLAESDQAIVSGDDLDRQSVVSGGDLDKQAVVSGDDLDRQAVVSGGDVDRQAVVSGDDLDRQGVVSGDDLDRQGVVSGDDLDRQSVVSGGDLDKQAVVSGDDLDRQAIVSGGDVDRQDVVSGDDLDRQGVVSGDDLDRQAVVSGDDLDRQTSDLDEARIQLKSLFASMKSLTAKEDMLNKLRQRLLVEIAKVHGYSKVMTGHCGTRLAVNLLSDISQGRGAHVAMDTAFSDTRYPNIMLVRPIREFSSKEVAMYNSLNGVESVFLPTLTTKTAEGSSIEHLTEAFVTGLQSDYPSTVSNIMRTGEKLSSEKTDGEHSVCALCQGPLDTDVGASSALRAVEFSRCVSQKQVEGCVDQNTCCGQGDGSCHTPAMGVKKEEVMSVLCYGCRLTISEMADITVLPDKLTTEISHRLRRSKMREDIQDFLLDPEIS